MSQNKKITQAVMLASGQGTRLMPLTKNTSKSMVRVNGKPFFEYVVELLRDNGIEEILFLLGYLPEQIVDYFGDGKRFGMKMRYHYGGETYGKEDEQSGFRMKKAKDMINDEFMVVYNDNYWPLKLDKLLEFHQEKNLLGTTVVYSNKDNYSKNNILLNSDGVAEIYDRSRAAPGLNGIEIGFSLMRKEVLDFMPNVAHEENVSFEAGVLPELVKRKELAGFFTDHRYYTIGSLERFHQAEEFLRPKKVVLLDRDGVINEKPPQADYVKNWGEFKFLPGAIEAIKLLTDNSHQIYLISNQPGIIRGKMTLEDLEDIHKNLRLELEKHGAKIDGIYTCLHNWDDGCECRKPKPGMLFQAARENKFDLIKAIFIGDDERDASAGEAADCRTILIDSENNLLKVVKSLIKK